MGRKSNPDLYYFNKFVRELMEQNAEIRIYGKTYCSSNKSLTIKNLVGEICDFDKKSKLGDVTRKTMELRQEYTMFGSIRDKQRRVLRQLDFYFGSADDPKPNTALNQFIVEQQGNILHLIPDLPDRINQGIKWAITRNSVTDLLELIDVLTQAGGPFADLFQKVQERILFEDDSFRQKIHDGLKVVWQEYQEAFSRHQKEYPFKNSRIIPFYDPDFHTPLADTDPAPSSLKVDWESAFEDRVCWFDENRYKRLQLLKPSLMDTEVPEWPDWTIEHVLLAELEYQYLYSELWNKTQEVLQEHLCFTAYLSATRSATEVESKITTPKILGQELVKFNIPGNFEDQINIRRGTILEGSYSKYPARLGAKNEQDPLQINYDIIEQLAKHCFERVYNSVGLDQENWTADKEDFGEMAYQVLK